jgi:mRNA-degrading endonuclease RelE of RelBE toxin-antitoxin system
MTVIETDDFQRILGKFPPEIQRLYTVQKERFLKNWRDPRLHIKKVQSLSYALSFRITRRYRVFFYFQNADTAIFFDVDHRKDVYRKF